jgi:hypothetical protein
MQYTNLKMFPLNKLSSDTDFLDVDSSEQHALFLYPGRIILYNWIHDKVLGDYVVDNTMTNIEAHFTKDGRIIRACLMDASNRKFVVIDFIKKSLCNIDVGKNCTTVVPLFHKNHLWVLDSKTFRYSS